VAAIVQKTLAGLAQEGHAFVGCLFAGLMLTKQGPVLLEYNTRMGDPETQVVLPLLESDLFDVCLACVEGRLAGTPVKWRAGMHAATVVLASSGYPESYAKGMPIRGLGKTAECGGVTVFHAGTVADGSGQVVANGGRVLAVTGVAASLQEAVDAAYAGVACVEFEPKTSVHFRTDIAHRALPPAARAASSPSKAHKLA
jgi:phosphoribosylamine-glycine ligase